MLVWFEHGHSRTISVPFSTVREIRIIPALEDLQEEVHLLTTDGKKFMLAIGAGSANNTQTTAIVIGKVAVRGKPSEKRIQSSPPTPRPTPLLQMGKIDDPNALVDPATIAQDLPDDIKPIASNTGPQSIGEDPSLTAGSGTIAKADINSITLLGMNRFRACYQREFQNSSLGKVVVRATVNVMAA